MPGEMNLKIRTPEKEFYNGTIKELITENENGRIGILHNHTSMITNIVPCITTITEATGKEIKAFTSSGVLSVSNNIIELLCDSCEWPEDIDIKRAEAARERAEKRLEDKSKIDAPRAEIALKRALLRIKIKE